MKGKNINFKLQQNFGDTDLKKEIFEDEISDFNDIKENEIVLKTIYVYEEEQNIEVKGYVCNGFKNDIQFGTIPICLIDLKGKIISEKNFDLSSLGNINPHSAIPIKVYFQKVDGNKIIDGNKIDIKDLKIAFKNTIKGEIYLNVDYEGLPEDIGDINKEILVNFLKELPKIKEGEFSISTFSIGFIENGKILITLILRNGNNDVVNLSELPVKLKDASGQTIKSQIFKLNDFSINSCKAKILNLEMDINIPIAPKDYLEGWNIEFYN